MATNNSKRKQENLRRRKKTLVKKVYEFGKDFDFEVALILSKKGGNGRYFTFRSLDQDTWPPSMEQIVSQCNPYKPPTKLRSKQQLSYPVPINLLPRDIEGCQSSVEWNLWPTSLPIYGETNGLGREPTKHLQISGVKEVVAFLKEGAE
jgi:hypothetical protein